MDDRPAPLIILTQKEFSLRHSLRILIALFLISLPVLAQAETTVLPTEEEMNAPMSFSFDPGGWIRAVGDIDPGTADRFAAFLSANQNKVGGKFVQLFSYGGKLFVGIELGKLIRNAGLDTMVGGGRGVTDEPAVCGSACTLAFLGGIRRHVVAPAQFIVHAPSTDKEDGTKAAVGEKAFTSADIALQSEVASRVLDWATSQGVHPLLIVALLSTPNTSQRDLKEEEVRGWRVDNMWPITAKQQANFVSWDPLRRELCRPVLLEDSHPVRVKRDASKYHRHAH